MSRISEYAKEHKLPLVVACGKGVEGDGILMAISKSKAKVRYDGFDMTYKIPDEMDDFVIVNKSLDDRMRSAFREYDDYGGMKFVNENYGKYLTNNHIKDLTPEAKEAVKKEFPIRSKYVSRFQGESKVVSHGFFGEHAGDISFPDERDFVVALAYLSTPGKCTLVADVPPNHYEDFEALFPNVSYGHIESHNGGTCQFTLLFHGDLSDRPYSLAGEVMPSDDNRIIRSAFTYDLVENRGFVFGAEQDLGAIKATIPEEYRGIFDEMVERFSYGEVQLSEEEEPER